MHIDPIEMLKEAADTLGNWLVELVGHAMGSTASLTLAGAGKGLGGGAGFSGLSPKTLSGAVTLATGGMGRSRSSDAVSQMKPILPSNDIRDAALTLRAQNVQLFDEAQASYHLDLGDMEHGVNACVAPARARSSWLGAGASF